MKVKSFSPKTALQFLKVGEETGMMAVIFT
jgi:hypothetical protein